MNYSNRIFRVNGEGDKGLLMALKLAFMQAHDTSARWWRKSEKGLVLGWGDPPEECFPFPCKMTPEGVLDSVTSYLKEVDIGDIELLSFEGNADHDGDNKIGWSVYCEDWGYVDGEFQAICAVKPVYLWVGK